MNRKKLVTEMGRIIGDDFRNAEKLPLVVVLDNVRSLHNVGSVFRTSDAFRVQRIMLCDITATPPNAEIHKTALGAEDVVEWQYFESTDDAIAVLREQGYRIYSIEQCNGSIALQDFKTSADESYAILMGNEVKGVQQSVVDASDGAIEIPQFGTKHSLNVSVTAGMVIWEFAKKLGWV